MQPNIAMKFAGYMAWILLWKRCKFGEKNYYNSRDIEFFLGDYFLARPVHASFGAHHKNLNEDKTHTISDDDRAQWL